MSNNKSKYLPSIDSLRALAVLAVIIYHVDVNYLPGGFLGVDLFFVLSGYLISSLIIKEYRKTGSLNLYNFYIRRARRLLPAVYFMITVGLVVMVLFNEVLLRKSHLDAIFGYIYSSNWWYIFHKLDYFDSFGAQSPFKHLWSLAIEEQFYMIFPLLFLLVNGKKKSKDGTYKLNKNFLYVVLGLILVSLIAHILLFDINNISRIYFGTDTRAFSLLVGVVGAILYPMEKLHAKVTPQQNIMYSVVSLVSIATLITVMIYTSEYNTWLYRGGFLLVFLIFTLLMFLVARVGTLIPAPGVDVDRLASMASKSDVLSYINMFSGGAFTRISIFSLGIMILMKSLQAALSIQQCGTKPVVLGINSQDISIVQDMEKSIIHSLNYNIDKTNLNSFFDRKY